MEPLLKKINKVNYNNILEKVLEHKDFTSVTKSLLLSMLYKIETAYNDYARVKVLVLTKDKLLSNIIETIDKKCTVIKLVEPNTEIGLKMQKENIDSFIDKQLVLVCFPTEKSLLSGITLLMDKNFCVMPVYRIINLAVVDFFSISYSMNINECILNFDGWSWTNQSFKTDEFLYNVIFYNFLNLASLNFIEEWKNSSSNQDYIEKFTKILFQKYGEENTKKLLILFYRLFLKILVSNYKDEVNEILEEGKNLKAAIDFMSNKVDYMKNIYDKKQLINDRIRKIEEMMLDKEILNKAYNEANSELPIDKQIFSVRRFLLLIKQERENLYNEIKNYNMKLDPKRYAKEKKELEEKYLKFANIKKMQKSKMSLKSEIIYIQKKFLEMKELELNKIESKKEILDSLYILRYYKNLKLSNESYIKCEKRLKNALWNYERKLLFKAYQSRLLLKLSNNVLQSIEVMSKILDTKIINFSDIQVLPKVVKNQIVLDVYDGDMLDTSILLDENIKELTLRPNKKNKILI